MAIAEKTSNLIQLRGTTGQVKADAQFGAGRIIVATGTVENAADDSNGSTFLLCRLPSDCVLLPDTFFDVENDGFAQIVVGTKDDPTALVNVAKSGGAMVEPIAKGDATHGKYLWEVLGLAEDPTGQIELFKHAVANATGAGSTKFQIHYLYR